VSNCKLLSYPHNPLVLKPKGEIENNLLSYSSEELESLMERLGYRAFHGRQLYAWIYRKNALSFDEMTDLSKNLRGELKESFLLGFPKVLKQVTGERADSATKFLFELQDGARVETVFIPAEDRNTVCLSCQVGCAFGCTFCATGEMGLIRNMTAEEIIGTFLVVRAKVSPARLSNVVFMGMGEPLVNLPQVMKAWQCLVDPDGISLSHRKVTLSTIGIPKKIHELAQLEYPPKLVVSIGSMDEERRRQLLPIAGRYSLKELHLSLELYALHTRNRITIAFLIAEGLNDTVEDARKLHRWIGSLPVKVNLLRYNEASGGFSPPDEIKVEQVAAELVRLGRTVVLRNSRGRDISAACGQLATK